MPDVIVVENSAINTIKRISVFGPGMMGHAIAQEFAVAGYDVTLYGRNEKRLDEARIAACSLSRMRPTFFGVLDFLERRL